MLEVLHELGRDHVDVRRVKPLLREACHIIQRPAFRRLGLRFIIQHFLQIDYHLSFIGLGLTIVNFIIIINRFHFSLLSLLLIQYHELVRDRVDMRRVQPFLREAYYAVQHLEGSTFGVQGSLSIIHYQLFINSWTSRGRASREHSSDFEDHLRILVYMVIYGSG